MAENNKVKLSKQKLDIDEAERSIRIMIDKLESHRKVLLRGIEEIDKGEDIFTGKGIIASDVRNVMRKYNSNELL